MLLFDVTLTKTVKVFFIRNGYYFLILGKKKPETLTNISLKLCVCLVPENAIRNRRIYTRV